MLIFSCHHHLHQHIHVYHSFLPALCISYHHCTIVDSPLLGSCFYYSLFFFIFMSYTCSLLYADFIFMSLLLFSLSSLSGYIRHIPIVFMNRTFHATLRLTHTQTHTTLTRLPAVHSIHIALIKQQTHQTYQGMSTC